MARKVKSEVESEDTGLDISSLIDVSFLLLIYFLVTSSLQKKESDLGISIPSRSSSSSSVETEPMGIEILSDGVVRVNDNETFGQNTDDRELELLHERLRMYKATLEASGSDPMVILNASDGVSQQRFVDVINCLAKVEISQISMTGFDND